MGYPTVQFCTVLDIRVYIISEVKLIIKVLGYSMGNFRLARPIRVNDVDYSIFVIGETFGYFNHILTIQHIGAVFLPSAANNFSWLVTLTN